MLHRAGEVVGDKETDWQLLWSYVNKVEPTRKTYLTRPARKQNSLPDARRRVFSGFSDFSRQWACFEWDLP